MNIPDHFSPNDFFFAIARSTRAEMEAIGIVQPEMDFSAARRAVVGVISDNARLVDGTLATYENNQRTQRAGTGTVLARFWIETVFNNMAGKQIYFLCRMVTGSPAGWQPRTIIITRAVDVHPSTLNRW